MNLFCLIRAGEKKDGSIVGRDKKGKTRGSQPGVIGRQDVNQRATSAKSI